MSSRAVFKRAYLPLLLILLASGCMGNRVAQVMNREEPPIEPVASEETSQIRWLKYFDALGAEGRRQDRAMLLYFEKDSCAPCKMMENRTFTDYRVKKALAEFIPVKISADTEIQIIRRYNIRMFPMIVFARAGGEEIDRKAGYRDADFLLFWMEDVKAGRKTFESLGKKLLLDPADLESLLAQAHNFVDAGQIEQAMELAQKAEEVAPEDPNVSALFGLCHLRNGRLEEAEKAVAEALELDSQNEEARRLKIAMLMKKADTALVEAGLDDALKLYFEVLEIAPRNYDARMAVGHAYMKDGRHEKAFGQFQLAAGLRPNSVAPIAALGDYYWEKGDDVMAERQFLKAVEIEPGYELPYFRLIELYEKNGRRAEMMGMYERILLFQPAGAHNEIAWLMATSKHPEILDPDAAIKHANMAIELEPRSWYIDTLAEAYFARGDFDLAIAVIKEAMAKKPDDMEYYEKQLEKFQKAKNGEPGE